MNLEGKSAVITGGGRGIGAEVARYLHRSGAQVLVSARSQDQIEAVAQELGGATKGAFAFQCDVTKPESIAALAEFARTNLGQVDILVNNAGVASSAPIRSLDLNEWERLHRINATGPFLCTKEFFEGMTSRGWGRIINIASIAGVSGAAYIAGYAASKHALVGFTRCLAAEGVRHGVTANAICPGYVDTKMTTDTVERIVAKTGLSEEKAMASVVKMNPQGRLIQPAEVAHAVLMLCDENAAGINGQTLVIDGGA